VKEIPIRPPPIITVYAKTGSYFVNHHEPISSQMAIKGVRTITTFIYVLRLQKEKIRLVQMKIKLMPKKWT
jgi:hypothetical protein